MGGLTNTETADVYRTYGHLVLRRCRTVLRNDGPAEDALQEVFMRVMTYGEELRRVESRLAWLYRVADRCCFDLLARSRRTVASDILEETPGRHPGSVFEARDQVMRLLHDLDDRDRHIAVATWVDGRTQDAIAGELGVTRQTVNRRIQAIQERAQRMTARR